MTGTQRSIIYPARIIRTLDPARPVAQAVAVRGDRILAVGSLAELRRYPGTAVDDRYADTVLLPGFVEAHSHTHSGGLWDNVYVGRFDRRDPDGRLWPGCATTAQVLERLREAERLLPPDPSVVLTAWGLDPIYYPGEQVLARELDTVSTTRPIKVDHASGHIVVLNSAALQRCGIAVSFGIEGVEVDAHGAPTGELREFAAMALAAPLAPAPDPAAFARALARFGRDAVNNGVTTATDLGTELLMDDGGVAAYRAAVGEDYPARLSVFHYGGGTVLPAQAADRLQRLRGSGTDRLRMGHVKLFLDGSIQGFTARLQEPGYLNGQPNGLWSMPLQAFAAAFEDFHRAGLLVHVHCNGDEATEVFLDVVEDILARHPRPDHRHTVTHSQLSTPAQYRRMAALGVGANLFANHIRAWGDQHMDITVGPDRAARMNATATALRAGVPIALHSDTPVTEMAPLKSVQHAATRLTASGRVMGGGERISVAQGLHAVTLGAAYLLKMDHEVGSLEPGKFADLAVLAEDPFQRPAAEVGSIAVAGTMVGGRHCVAAV
ncbi:amidohydrolase [Arthrobacter sp. 35W]|uniref:amidohydrolase n=1 Tax=Arthrobacter sp. 35W TaxID=1132441 RepID=UPI0003FED032|nr:amidohydrolase [Arthrobacter sp. 35W]